MRFRTRSSSRSVCGCETGTGPVPLASISETAWAAPDGAEPVACGVSREEAAHIALSTAPVGSRGHIAGVELAGAPALVRRLHDLGFVAGATIEVVRRAPLGDPVLYRVSDYEICLRRAQAAAIRVRLAAPGYVLAPAPSSAGLAAVPVA